MLGIFSLDFLALECYQGGVRDRYFTTVLLWCTIPLLLAAVVLAVGMLRIAVARRRAGSTAADEDEDEDDTDAVVGESDRDDASSRIANQHMFLLLLLSYLVLPPVASKQFQSLDCIPFPHDGSLYLRVDTAIDCRSDEYLRFRAVVVVMIFLYQLIPIAWLVLLFRRRNSLDPSTSNHDSRLGLFVRDQDRSLDSIRFLFNDYKPSKWWFECVEMVRAIVLFLKAIFENSYHPLHNLKCAVPPNHNLRRHSVVFHCQRYPRVARRRPRHSESDVLSRGTALP